ncbi:sigma-E factor negative regulatory protein, partial [Rugamonas sp. CCM 8940]
MDTLKSLHENISALADGELPDSELELTLAALNDAEGRLAWQTYHLIGDMLRGAEALPGAAFAARLAARLAAEDEAAAAAA